MPDEILAEAITETAVASGLLEKDEGGKGKAPGSGSVCSNCHARLLGRHCHICGQVADTYHRPVWSLFSEILEGYLGLDGRLWRTIPALLFKPGKITAHYLQGVRQPYMTPIRLFLLSSLLFFLTFTMLVSNSGILKSSTFFNNSDDNKTATQEIIENAKSELKTAESEASTPDDARGIALAHAGIDAVDQEIKRQQGTATPSRFSLREKAVCELRKQALPEDPPTALCADVLSENKSGDNTQQPEQNDKTIDLQLSADENGLLPEASIDTDQMKSIFSLEERRFLIDNIETAVNNPDQYKATLGRWAPRLAFVLAPAYGLILALSFFWRREFYLYDHMVVTLHFHSFLFLFLVLLIPLGIWVNAGLAIVLFLLWSNYYLYRLMRHVYSASVTGAILRVIVIDNIYMLLLTLAFLALLFLGIVFV
ncbi:MAG: hypothetical protein COA84_09220 [Robiginitomaculum sp.]|nr:MAG: hypothetical protein COA84_09220 [Robiginitomaculum sp.]